jgi:hypothetical protein
MWPHAAKSPSHRCLQRRPAVHSSHLLIPYRDCLKAVPALHASMQPHASMLYPCILSCFALPHGAGGARELHDRRAAEGVERAIGPLQYPRTRYPPALRPYCTLFYVRKEQWTTKTQSSRGSTRQSASAKSRSGARSSWSNARLCDWLASHAGSLSLPSCPHKQECRSWVHVCSGHAATSHNPRSTSPHCSST